MTVQQPYYTADVATVYDCSSCLCENNQSVLVYWLW